MLLFALRCVICYAGDLLVDPCFLFEFRRVQMSDDGDISAEVAGLAYYLRNICGEDDSASKLVHKVYQSDAMEFAVSACASPCCRT